MLFGGHFPISNGLGHALKKAYDSGGNTMQFFTKNPGQWKARPIEEKTAGEFKSKSLELNISPLIVHDSYLINLASPNEELLHKSRNALIEEIHRTDFLKAQFLVTHLGSHMGTGEKQGMKILHESLEYCLEQTVSSKVILLLETTAGQGSQLGYKFEQIGSLIRSSGFANRLRVCLDTCHVFAAGYDLSSYEGYQRTFEDFEKNIGIENLKAIHANDAERPLGSRIDRHKYLGEGYIGENAFKRLVKDYRFKNIPFILETNNPETMHKVYIKKLKEWSES